MKNVLELHTDHLELTSDINFYENEIEFLLKLINGEYKCAFSSRQKIKTLDAYYIEFEKYKNQLNQIETKISKHEKDLSLICKDELVNLENTQLKDDTMIIKEYYNLIKGLKVLKESLYSFISELHKG